MMRNHRKVLVVGLIACAIGGCKDREGEPVKRVEDVHDSPLRYLGRTVTISGRVDNVFADRAFELEGDGLVWTKKLVVLTRTPVAFGPTKLANNEQLVVTGTVHRMSPDDAALDHDLGNAPDPALVQRHRDEPVLIADSVQLVETQALWSSKYQQGAIVSAIRVMSAIDPAIFAEHVVDLADVPVRTITSEGMWVGFGPHSELYLVPATASQLGGLQAGDRVAIHGTVHAMPPDATGLLEPARLRGEKIYLQASELTKLAPRPGT